MNTRMFPRTTNEAFRNTAEYGCAIERPRKADKAVNWILALAAIAIVLSLIFQGAPK